MNVEIRPVPRAEWSPVPAEGAVGVESKALVHQDDLFVAILRFAENATIHEHPGPNDTIVVCLEGEGFTSVAGDTAALKAGEQARWPKDVPHRLWTEGSTMVTLMIERPPTAK
jgi:quercetin dioxygenase-like cupin family protein